MNAVPIVPLSRADSVEFYPTLRQGGGRNRQKRRRQGEGDEGAEEHPAEVPEELLLSSDDQEDQEGCPSEHDEEREEVGSLALFLDDNNDALQQPLESQLAPAEVAPPSAPEQKVQAVGAAEAPPSAPPPPPEPANARRRGRGHDTVVFPWGKITFYESKGGAFEAICRNPAHGKCVLTRGARGKPGASSSTSAPRGGRPLGFLAAWLAKGDAASKEEHWSDVCIRPSLAARQAGREFVRSALHGEALMARERPAVPGEPPEPPTLDGLI